MVDDDTLLELWQCLLKDPRVSDAEIRRQCLVALLGNENFRLQLIEWFLRDEPGNVPQRTIVSH